MAAVAGCSSVCLGSRLAPTSALRRAARGRTSAILPKVRARGQMAVAAAAKNYNITLLPGDGIGPEIMAVAKDVLIETGSQFDIDFNFTEALVGGSAIDATGVPLPPETLATCKASDAVLLAAIGGCVTRAERVSSRARRLAGLHVANPGDRLSLETNDTTVASVRLSPRPPITASLIPSFAAFTERTDVRDGIHRRRRSW